ncbi:acyltransferase [Nocardioides ferulae]|uniref:acyltransferase n=1 Tax=Nocardioides ferulae TaxID=2340821 RepID=UPI001F0C74A7|nr:acyltransferase [Nocardioides ferulae]
MSLANRWINRGLVAAWRWAERRGEIVPGTHAGDRFGSLGEGSAIGFPMATLMNPGSIHVGSGALIGRHVTLSVGYGPGAPNLPERGLVIGDRCIIGARSSLTAHRSIVLGDDVWFGQDVFVCDSSHGYQDPEVPIGCQLGEHQPVEIGSGSWLGHGAIVLPGTRLGRNVVVAAGSVVRGEVPDNAVVGGSPARPLRRFEPEVGWVSERGHVRPILRGMEQLEALEALEALEREIEQGAQQGSDDDDRPALAH